MINIFGCHQHRDGIQLDVFYIYLLWALCRWWKVLGLELSLVGYLTPMGQKQICCLQTVGHLFLQPGFYVLDKTIASWEWYQWQQTLVLVCQVRCHGQWYWRPQRGPGELDKQLPVFQGLQWHQIWPSGGQSPCCGMDGMPMVSFHEAMPLDMVGQLSGYYMLHQFADIDTGL